MCIPSYYLMIDLLVLVVLSFSFGTFSWSNRTPDEADFRVSDARWLSGINSQGLPTGQEGFLPINLALGFFCSQKSKTWVWNPRFSVFCHFKYYLNHCYNTLKTTTNFTNNVVTKGRGNCTNHQLLRLILQKTPFSLGLLHKIPQYVAASSNP